VKITFFGVRGSVPCPGADTVRFGGNTPCLEIRGKNDELIILDAGTGIRELGETLADDASGIIIFSHVHWDHIQGLPFFGPLYKGGCSFRLFAQRPGEGNPKENILWEFQKPNFPTDVTALKGLESVENLPSSPFDKGGIRVSYMQINHPDPTQGIRLDEGESSVVYMTDNEADIDSPDAVSMKTLAEFAMNADLIVHDAMYLPEEIGSYKGWGHSTYEESIRLAVAANAKRLALFHHSPGRDDNQVDEIVKRACEFAASIEAEVEIFGAREGFSLTL